MKDCDLYEFLKNKRKLNEENKIESSIPPSNNIKILNSNLRKIQKKKRKIKIEIKK